MRWVCRVRWCRRVSRAGEVGAFVSLSPWYDLLNVKRISEWPVNCQYSFSGDEEPVLYFANNGMITR